MPFSPGLIVVGMVLALAQVAAALPWGLALTWDALRAWYRQAPRQRLAALVGGLVAAVLAGGVLLGVAISVVRERESVEVMGRVYAVVFQLQLTADFFVLIFLGLTRAWPKGGAVARAAFRESYRQPMFWLFVGASVGWLALTPFLPYFTFGEDYIMVKEIGYDTIMLAAVAFGVIAASMSISEEIEGRTAVTLMSKPVSRRQFLLGKFFGILLACLVMVAVLGLFFDLVLLYKYWFDKLPPRRLPPDVAAWVDRLGGPLEARHFLRGTVIWVFHAGEILPGQVMSSSLVMVLVAVAVALATRLPMIVNLVTCLVIYFLANLMPVLVKTTQPAPGSTPGPVQKLIYFMAQLFDALLPGLDLFRVRPTLVDENALSIDEYLQHVGVVTVYGILFTTIVLLLGLVLFEDRDLA